MAFVIKNSAAKNTFLIVCATLIVALVFREQWLKTRQIVAPRGDPSDMADAVFFRVIERDVINRTVTEMEDLADGYLRVYASEVPYVSLLLFRTLAAIDGAQKQIFATDLTRNPKILLTRQDYLAANRHLIRAGGSIQRIFVCKVDNLMTQSFAEDLIALVDQHRCRNLVRAGGLGSATCDRGS